MMTLVIYDDYGNVIYTIAGAYTIPKGVPAIEVNVPDGYAVQSVNINVEPNEAVLVPVNQLGMSLADAKTSRINELKRNLEIYFDTNKLESTVHLGEKKLYSVTKEKQNQLIAEIVTAERAQQKGKVYEISWNAAGEVKTNDWTLTQLYDLLFEIKNYVGPFVEEEQNIEMQLKNTETIEELYSIDIEFI